MVSIFTIFNSLSQTSLPIDSRSWGLNHIAYQQYSTVWIITGLRTGMRYRSIC